MKFAAIDRVALTQIGFNLFSTNDKMIGATSTEQFPSPRFSQLQPRRQVGGQTVNFSDLLNLFAFRPDLNIGATIKALQERNLLQILAEPNLITVEGKEATFLAGGSFPFPTITTTPTGGATAPVITVQFKPFGVKLDFTPTVTPQGSIDLKVAPEVSSLDYANAVTLQGFLIPALSQRRAETEVILKDGESFAIAGLIDNRVIETMYKVPGLGDVPVLGKIFRSRSTQKSTDELLVVVTPHFVKPLSAGRKGQTAGHAGHVPAGSRSRGSEEGKGGKNSTQDNRQGPGICRTPWPADTQAVATRCRGHGLAARRPMPVRARPQALLHARGVHVDSACGDPGAGGVRHDGFRAGSGPPVPGARGTQPGRRCGRHRRGRAS